MTTASPPDQRMLVGIPVGGGRLDRILNLLPGLKAPAFKSQRPQDLPPGFNEIEIGGICRLIDTFPAWMMDHEQQQIPAMMHLQIIHDGIDALLVFWDLRVHIAEKVHEVDNAASWVATLVQQSPVVSHNAP